MIEHFFANLPAIIVALPILISPILAIFGGKSEFTRWISWLITFATTGLAFSFSSYIFIDILQHGATSYYFGAWPAPIGIEYEITDLNALILLLVSGMAFILMPYALDSVEEEIPKEKTPLFYSCFLLCLSGLFGMIMSNDLFNIFVFLEISSLTTYALVAMGRANSSVTAAFHYLIIGTIGATFYLTGVAFLYIITGSLNFSDIAQILANSDMSSKPILAAFSFLVIGLGIKSGIVPLASWLVRSYASAPSFISAFISATATKVSLLILIRILFIMFGVEFSFETIGLSNLFIAVALVAMIYGSISALMQTNVKRLLAFSSLANIGYILFAVAALGKFGLVAAIFHMISHAFAKSGLFLCAGVAYYKNGGVNLEHFKNLGRTAPVTMACFVIFALSLVGIPLTSGFISKWYMINAALETNSAVLVIAVLATSSILTLFYMWKIIDIAYSGKDNAKVKEAPYHMQISIICLAILTIGFGLFGLSAIEYITEISVGMM